MRVQFRGGPRAGEEVVLEEGRTYAIGRDAAADLVIDDTRVSRRHAVLRTGRGEAVLEDVGSRNGTTVDGRAVTGPTSLRGGEVVGLGGVELRIKAEPMAPATPADAVGAGRIPGPATVERAALRASVARANLVALVSLGLVVVLVVGGLGIAASGVLDRSAPSRSEVIAGLRPSTVLVSTDLGQGTGWVLDAAAGLIVTNNHVINGATEITIGGEDVAKRPASVVATAPCEDLAVLRVASGDGLRTLPLGSQSSLRQGDDVLALGYPASAGPGDKVVATDGIVSVVQEDWALRSVDVPHYPNVIQTNADINPGNSGGPLVTLDGRLVGVNSAGITDYNGRTIQGQGYAIGVDRVQEVVPDLRTGRSWAWTGMGLEYPFPEVLDAYKLPDRKGLVVASATPGTPAADAGFGTTPVIVVEIDGVPMDGSLAGYCETVSDRRAGDEAVFSVVGRDGSRQDVRVPFQ